MRGVLEACPSSLGAGGVLVGLAGAQLALAVSGAVPLVIGLVTLLLIVRPRLGPGKAAYAR